MVLGRAIVLYETQIGANSKGTLILKAVRSIIALVLSHKAETKKGTNIYPWGTAAVWLKVPTVDELLERWR